MARDDDRPLPPQSEVTPSLTAELIFAANLVASSEPRPGAPEGWAEAQRALLPAAVRARLSLFSSFWWPTLGLVDFLCHNACFHDLEAFWADVERRPVGEFLSILLNGDLTVAEADALVRSPEGLESVTENFSRFSQGSLAAHHQLFSDPTGFRTALGELLRASDTPFFRQTFEGLKGSSRPSVQTLSRRLETEEPLAVAESLWERTLMPMSGPYRWFTFVPSALMGHAHIQSWGNQRATFFLQEGRSSLTAPTATGRELAEFLKVLSDPTRMDILRILCCQPSYGKEIAERLQITTATVSRHLDQLKAAGLVREDRADANNVKRLRYSPEALDSQLERLRTYLLHS